MPKISVVGVFLLLGLIADLFGMRQVIIEWRAFNSDPGLTLFTQIILAIIIVFYLLQMIKRRQSS